MSRYFQTLKKLQQQRDEEFREPLQRLQESPPSTEVPAPKWESETADEVFPELPLAYREAAWSHMLEALRAQTHSPQPILVVAGVSDIESTHRLVMGIRRQAASKGIHVRAARLSQSQQGRLLALLPDESDDRSSTPRAQNGTDALGGLSTVRGFNFSGRQADQTLTDWLRASGAGSDMLLIEAPGVLTSADTLQLAKTCDGLAMVVEPMVTDRTALKSAVSRAQASGCTIVGLIVSDHRDWLPRWLRRLLPDS